MPVDSDIRVCKTYLPGGTVVSMAVILTKPSSPWAPGLATFVTLVLCTGSGTR